MNTKKSSACIAIALILVSTLFANGIFNKGVVSAHSGDILGPAWASVVPTIDGVISIGEWDDADFVSFLLEYSDLLPETTVHEARMYVKNDETWLYLAVVVEWDDYNTNDFGNWLFENDHDGVIEVGDDGLSVRSDGLSTDCYRTNAAVEGWWSSDTGDGGTNDIVGAASHTNPTGVGDYTFEYRHPLDTADDTHDFSLKPGDTVGFQFSYADGGVPADDEWPGLPDYGDIVIASKPFSAWTSVAPEIDGFIEADEWAAADTAKYETTNGIVGTFYVMNDVENLYIALTTTDSTLSEDTTGIDAVCLYFDNDNDGRGPEAGDDIYGWNGYLSEHFKDGFAKDGSYSWYRDIDYGGTSDGAAAARNIERKFNSFETAHPLYSKDNYHDFSLRLGDTVGFALRVIVDGYDKGWWPSSDLAVWHDILIASPPAIHDVAVISLDRYPLYVRQGDPVLIGATVENQGYFTENFDVTFYVTRKFKILPWNPPIEISIPIETRTVTGLAPGGMKSLIIIWNTAGFVLDNYIIKAYAHLVPGEIDKTDNVLVDGTVELYRGIGYFIIVAGNKNGDKLDLVNGGCNEVFKTLRDVGYSGSRIYYMNQPEYYPQDVDGDGLNDIDALSTSTNLQWAIETWASSKVGPSEPLFLYLFDHGGWDYFCIDTPDTVSSTQLESWLDTLEEATSASIHVIYAACHSGSFIEELSSTGRVIATSCRDFEGSDLAPDGTWEAFSQPFWIQIKSGHSVGWSFDSACTAVASYTSQIPLLDDNGDQTGHTGPLPNGGDGFVADSLYIGSCEWTFPWISYIVEKQFFAWPPPPTVTLWATVENETPLVHVRAWMQPPDWEPPPPDEVLIDPGFECFEMIDPDHDGTWTVDIPAVNFTNHATGPSDFKFIITAEEENGMTAIPLVTGVGFTETGEPPEDNTPPSVRIERPLDMQTVQGTIRINGTATDDVCLETVEVYVDGDFSSAVDVPPTSNSFFELNLDTTTIPNGPRTILVRALDTSHNSGYQTLTLLVNNFVHDIAVTDITPRPLKTIVGQGLTLRVNVTVANHGSYTENFNVTAYANTNVIGSAEVTVTTGSYTVVTFTWDTTGFPKGNYTIKAYATPVLGETDLIDNTYVNSWVVVTIPGDMDGDFDVDFDDIVAVCMAYMSKPGAPNWNPNADIDGSSRVDFDDVVTAAMNYGKKDP